MKPRPGKTVRPFEEIARHVREVGCVPRSEQEWLVDMVSRCERFRFGDWAVEARGKGRWAVVDRWGGVLARDGFVEGEPFPSNRTEEFLARTRYTLDEALTLARHRETGGEA